MKHLPRLLAGLMLAGAALPLPAFSAPAPAETLAPVTLIDDTQSPRRLPDGKVWVVTFFYGNCVDVCPLLLYNLADVAAALPEADRQRVGFAGITFDTKRDTPELLTQYKENFELKGDHFKLFTGADADLARLFTTFRFDFKPDRNDGYQHVNLMAIMDEQGRVVRHFYGLQPNIDQVVEAIRAELTN